MVLTIFMNYVIKADLTVKSEKSFMTTTVSLTHHAKSLITLKNTAKHNHEFINLLMLPIIKHIFSQRSSRTFKNRLKFRKLNPYQVTPSMGQKVTCEALVEGGKASAGPPIAPVLGPTGANLFMIVQKINELTADFKGLKVPVTIVVDTDTKEFEVTVGLPPTSALILKEIGAEKGTGTTGTEVTGDLSFDQVVSVARAKERDLLGRNLSNQVKSVLGTCFSMGVTVEGMDPREIQRGIDQGEYADKLKE